MKSFLDGIQTEDTALENLTDSEVYKSVRVLSVFEMIKETPRRLFVRQAGAAVRVNKQDNAIIYTSPDTYITGKWFNHALANTIPYYKLPYIQTDLAENLPRLTIDGPEMIRSKVGDIRKKLLEKQISIEKLSVEESLNLYTLRNTYGVNGVGYKYVYVINCLCRDQKDQFFEMGKVYDLDQKDKAFSLFENSVQIPSAGSQADLGDIKVSGILLSSNAVLELMYLFFFLFTDQAVRHQQSRVVTALMKHDVLLSHLLNITENAPENKMIGGNIDGEGTSRKPVNLFNHGRYENIISRFSLSDDGKCSGSAYRFEYSVLPETKASKIYISPGIKTEKELLSSGAIGKIESFQGMYESLNKDTFDFSAVLHMAVYKNGQHLGYTTRKTQLNLIRILSGVEEITRNAQYSGDGSYLMPSMICRADVFYP